MAYDMADEFGSEAEGGHYGDFHAWCCVSSCFIRPAVVDKD